MLYLLKQYRREVKTLGNTQWCSWEMFCSIRIFWFCLKDHKDGSRFKGDILAARSNSDWTLSSFVIGNLLHREKCTLNTNSKVQCSDGKLVKPVETSRRIQSLVCFYTSRYTVTILILLLYFFLCRLHWPLALFLSLDALSTQQRKAKSIRSQWCWCESAVFIEMLLFTEAKREFLPCWVFDVEKTDFFVSVFILFFVFPCNLGVCVCSCQYESAEILSDTFLL